MIKQGNNQRSTMERMFALLIVFSLMIVTLPSRQRQYESARVAPTRTHNWGHGSQATCSDNPIYQQLKGNPGWVSLPSTHWPLDFDYLHAHSNDVDIISSTVETDSSSRPSNGGPPSPLLMPGQQQIGYTMVACPHFAAKHQRPGTNSA